LEDNLQRRGAENSEREADHLTEGDLNEVACGHGNRGRDILWSSVHYFTMAVPSLKAIKAPANASLQRESIVAP
jgi:hypothetical protein